jgi:hypothetical protein
LYSLPVLAPSFYLWKVIGQASFALRRALERLDKVNGTQSARALGNSRAHDIFEVTTAAVGTYGKKNPGH